MFHIELYEWISRLTERHNGFKGDEPKHWTLELIQQLKNNNNIISRDVDFRVDNILEGFITKFIVDTTISYNEANENFSRDHEVST